MSEHVSSGYSAPMPPVPVPADLDVEEKLAGPFTARQCAILAATAVCVLGVTEVLRRIAHPTPLLLVGCAAPLTLAGFTLALVRPGGIPADVLLTSAVRFLRAGRRHVQAGDGVALPPGVRRLAPLYERVTEVEGIGVAELDNGEAAAIVEVQPVCLNLIDTAEASTVLGAIGQVLAGQSGPASVSTITVRIDLAEHAEVAAAIAETLATPQLRAFGHAQAGHLRELAEQRELWHRRHLVTLRHSGPGAQTVAANRARNVAESLSACGIAATVLDASELTGLLATACDPKRHHSLATLAPPDEPVTALPVAPLPFAGEVRL